MRACVLAAVLLVAACTQVVVESSNEVRPSRYALIEFTQQLAAHDSAVAYARRALQAEQLELQPVNSESGVVIGGPARFAAEAELPALEATVTISTITRGTETKFRIYASATLQPNEVGGIDPRLMSLAQRLAQRIESMIAP